MTLLYTCPLIKEADNTFIYTTMTKNTRRPRKPHPSRQWNIFDTDALILPGNPYGTGMSFSNNEFGRKDGIYYEENSPISSSLNPYSPPFFPGQMDQIYQNPMYQQLYVNTETNYNHDNLIDNRTHGYYEPEFIPNADYSNSPSYEDFPVYARKLSSIEEEPQVEETAQKTETTQYKFQPTGQIQPVYFLQTFSPKYGDSENSNSEVHNFRENQLTESVYRSHLGDRRYQGLLKEKPCLHAENTVSNYTILRQPEYIFKNSCVTLMTPKHINPVPNQNTQKNRGLPDEFWMYIFDQYVPESDWINLSLVCRQWRYCVQYVQNTQWIDEDYEYKEWNPANQPLLVQHQQPSPRSSNKDRGSRERQRVHYNRHNADRSEKPKNQRQSVSNREQIIAPCRSPDTINFRTNSNMTSLSFAGLSYYLEFDALLKIGQSFPHLTEVILGDFESNVNPRLNLHCIQAFTMYFSKVERLLLETNFMGSKLFHPGVTRHDKTRMIHGFNANFEEAFTNSSCLQNLEHISLKGNDILNGSFLSQITQNLIKIDLSMCKNIEERYLLDFLTGRKLTEFIFEGNQTDLDVYSCMTKSTLSATFHLQNLKLLRLSCLKGWISSVPLDNFAYNLETLEIDRSTVFVESDLQKIFKFCRKLKVLKMSFVKNITVSTLNCLIKNCGALESLDLPEFVNATDHLPRLGLLPNLRDLGLSKSCATDKVISHLLQTHPNISINIYGDINNSYNS